MRLWVRITSLVMALVISVSALASCSLSPLEVVGSRVNEMGEVIIIYSNGSEVNIGIIGEGDQTSYNINAEDNGISNAASRGITSAVSISATFTIGHYAGGFFSSTAESRGSGVIYRLDKSSGEAFIITNYHVIYNAESTASNGISNDIKVFVYGSEDAEYAIPATFVGGSIYYDIAVLHVASSELMKRASVSAVTVCEQMDASVGETAIAVGNPEGAGISATLGVVSVDSEYIVMESLDGLSAVSQRVMRVDTAINSGNSGGGLYNSHGELIGIVNAKIADAEVENIGYAIPASVAIPVADNVIDNCFGKTNKSLLRPMLGITLGSSNAGAVINPETGLITKTESVLVSAVNRGGLADGVLKSGDIITEIKIGEKVVAITRSHHVIDTLLNARIGDVVEIKVLRLGEEKTAEIMINESALTKY